jgi:hypothetical protein
MEKRECLFLGCEKEAEFEIYDAAERRPDVGPTDSCEEHVGFLLGHVEPTRGNEWIVRSISKRTLQPNLRA